MAAEVQLLPPPAPTSPLAAPPLSNMVCLLPVGLIRILPVYDVCIKLPAWKMYSHVQGVILQTWPTLRMELDRCWCACIYVFVCVCVRACVRMCLCVRVFACVCIPAAGAFLFVTAQARCFGVSCDTTIFYHHCLHMLPNMCTSLSLSLPCVGWHSGLLKRLF